MTYPPEVVEAVRALPSDPPETYDRMVAALMEVAPDLARQILWVEVGGTMCLAAREPLSPTELRVLHRAYRIAGGTHGCCESCFAAGRGPLCSLGRCDAFTRDFQAYLDES